MKQELISIVVPIYNTDSYLEKCIKSIINQTYKNLEIILINDGSTDNSLNIINKYKKQDNRIRVLNQSNKGLSECRNIGIKKSKGEFIAFIDSDDYVDLKYIEILYKNIKEYDADMSICNYYEIKDNIKNIKVKRDGKALITDEKYYQLYNYNNLLTIVAWNKLYKRKIFNNIKYPINKIYEDEFVICNILHNCNKIIYDYTPLCYYIKRKDSITASNKNKNFDIIDALDNRMLVFQNEGINELIIETYKLKFYHLSNLIIKSNYKCDKKYIDEFKKVTRILLKNTSKLKYLIALNYKLYLNIKEIIYKM